jgi:hypothetical protein
VSETKRLAAKTALVVAAAALVGVSAFAEERHERGTNTWRERGGQIRREGAGDSGQRSRRDETRNDGAVRERSPRRESGSGSEIEVRGTRDRSSDANRYERGERSRTERSDRTRIERGDRNRSSERGERGDRGYDRNRGSDNRNRGSYDRDRNRGSSDHNRNRNYGRNDRNHHDRNYGRQPYYAHGRVSRVHPYNGGYRIWIDGARYPFFVPSRYYHRDRFRIGLSIRLGGWYNDGGYYDYYDGRSTGELYGVVESVDYRRNTFVVRNEATGNFVTVIARDAEADRLRAGDVVEIWGDWSRRGYFEARDVDRVDSEYREYRR